MPAQRQSPFRQSGQAANPGRLVRPATRARVIHASSPMQPQRHGEISTADTAAVRPAFALWQSLGTHQRVATAWEYAAQPGRSCLRARPKSASFSAPSRVSSTLLGFRSRCMKPAACDKLQGLPFSSNVPDCSKLHAAAACRRVADDAIPLDHVHNIDCFDGTAHLKFR